MLLGNGCDLNEAKYGKRISGSDRQEVGETPRTTGRLSDKKWKNQYF